MKNIIMMAMLLISITYAVTISSEVVIDNKTKLEWQNQPINKTATATHWIEAINYCESLPLDGKTDWRLPNINELKSLVDYTKFHPAMVSSLEETTANNKYWSSTTYLKGDLTIRVYYINFAQGAISTALKSNAISNVRCVRDKTE